MLVPVYDICVFKEDEKSWRKEKTVNTYVEFYTDSTLAHKDCHKSQPASNLPGCTSNKNMPANVKEEKWFTNL